jgi:hypothetical protein
MIPVLIVLAESPDLKFTSGNAIMAMGSTGSRAAILILLDYQNSPNVNIRTAIGKSNPSKGRSGGNEKAQLQLSAAIESVTRWSHFHKWVPSSSSDSPPSPLARRNDAETLH